MGISAKASRLNTLFVRIGIVSIFCLVSFSEAQAQVLKAKVEKVIDGDSLLVTFNDEFQGKPRTQKIHIRGIDAPELGQPKGEEAKRALTAILSRSRSILLQTEPIDIQSGYRLASLAVNGQDVGLELIEKGLSWCHFEESSGLTPDWKMAYQLAENEAKKGDIGIWETWNPVPPWIWRKENRKRLYASKRFLKTGEDSLSFSDSTCDFQKETSLYLPDWRKNFLTSSVSEEEKSIQRPMDSVWRRCLHFGEEVSQTVVKWFLG